MKNFNETIAQLQEQFDANIQATISTLIDEVASKRDGKLFFNRPNHIITLHNSTPDKEGMVLPLKGLHMTDDGALLGIYDFKYKGKTIEVSLRGRLLPEDVLFMCQLSGLANFASRQTEGLRTICNKALAEYARLLKTMPDCKMELNSGHPFVPFWPFNQASVDNQRHYEEVTSLYLGSDGQVMRKGKDSALGIDIDAPLCELYMANLFTLGEYISEEVDA